MPTLVERIEFDTRSLELYFERLFRLLDEVSNVPEESKEPRATWAPSPHSYVAFVKPDMLSNVYSLVDFWLSTLCHVAAQARALPLTHKEVRGANALDARHKFLTKVAGLELDVVAGSLEHIDIVRDARNCLMHEGGHASDRLSKRLCKRPNIHVTVGLVQFERSFILESLEHARLYLTQVAENFDDE